MSNLTFTTPDLLDEFREQVQASASGLNHYGKITKFYGQAVTVTCPQDNSYAVEALKQPGHGKVLVIDGFASNSYAFIGDMMAENAVKNGWEGVIVNGCCRDIEILVEMDIAVMALGVTPRSTIKRGFGDNGQIVDMVNVSISEGDWIYADLNGLVVSQTPLL